MKTREQARAELVELKNDLLDTLPSIVVFVALTLLIYFLTPQFIDGWSARVMAPYVDFMRWLSNIVVTLFCGTLAYRLACTLRIAYGPETEASPDVPGVEQR